MILSVIAFLVTAIFMAFKIRKKQCKKKFSFVTMSALTAMIVTAIILTFVSSLVIPQEEYSYTLSWEDTVVPIGYNASEPAANFLFDGKEYRYISSTNKDDPMFSRLKSDLVHINYSDGPARIESYKATGFKHSSTWLYGLLGALDDYYEVYAPAETIQTIRPE